MNEITVFVELFILMYADDTIILAETAEDLQKNLNIFCNYCDEWKLSINCSNTNIFILSKEKLKIYQHLQQTMKLLKL